MKLSLFRGIIVCLVLVLVQALVLNHIHLFGCAMPLFYVYLVLLYPRNYARWGLLLWGFFLGLVIDIFSNTPGVASFSLTLLSAIQPKVLSLFMTRDSADDLEPSFRSLGVSKFIYYSILLVLLYNIVFYTMETFNFFNWLQWIKCIVGSSILTEILILVVENVRWHK